MTVVTLSKPIQAHGETVSEITLRSPTVAEVSEFGYPYKLRPNGDDAEIELIPKIGLKYIGRIAALPPSSLEQLALEDLQRLQLELIPFFMGTAETPAS